MGKIVVMNTSQAADVVNEIMQYYQNGQIEGIVVGIKLKEGATFNGFTNDIKYIEKLGLCQSLINDINLRANE